MGREALCTVRFGDQVADGKALLETDELIFRGSFRLAVPLKQVRSVEARDGRLHIEFSDGVADFELGSQAEKWAHAILNPKSLLDKLGVKPGKKVSVLGITDPTFLEDLNSRIETISAGEIQPASDAIFVAVEGPEDLTGLAALKQAMKSDGAVWAVYPKGRKDFNENDILRGGLAAGLVDVKVVRFSDTHTATKFVIRESERPESAR